MATVNVLAKDGNANSATQSYILQLNASLQKLQAELDQANSLLSEAKMESNYTSALYAESQAELAIAQASYDDASEALDAITSLRGFFKDRMVQAQKSAGLAQDTAQETYTATLAMGVAAENIEYCYNLAEGYNSSDLGSNDLPYSGPVFLNNYQEASQSATSALATLITASQAAFQALADANQVLTMATYLSNGIEKSFQTLTDINHSAMLQRNQAKNTNHLAKMANDDATRKLTSAQIKADAASLQVNLAKAELQAAQQGAAGVAAKS